MSASPVILIGHFGSLGDVVLSLQGIRALHRTFPSYELVLWTQNDVGKLLHECGEVHSFWPLEGPIGGFLLGEVSSSPVQVQSVLQRCSHGIFWMRSENDFLNINMRKAGVKDLLCCSPVNNALNSIHMEDRFLETLHPFGISINAPRTPLRIPKKDNQEGRNEKTMLITLEDHERVIMVHPGSGSIHKCCPSDFLIQMVRRLICFSNIKILVCGGPADHDILQRFKVELMDLPIQFVCEKDLGTIARVFCNVDVFVGHDSGLTHLASAFGVKTLALFGPTDPSKWGPRGGHVRILRGATCRCQEWCEVQQCSTKKCLQFSMNEICSVVEDLMSECSHALR